MSRGTSTQVWVRSVEVCQGQLVAGGLFTKAGGVDTNYVARWDGIVWQGFGSGLDNEVITLAVYDGNLVAGGFFRKSGGLDVNGIACWNGSAWQGLGGGMSSAPAVSDLMVSDEGLIAAGWFTKAGGIDADCIARWDGNAWQGLWQGLNASVGVLAMYNGDLMGRGRVRRPRSYCPLERQQVAGGWKRRGNKRHGLYLRRV